MIAPETSCAMTAADDCGPLSVVSLSRDRWCLEVPRSGGQLVGRVRIRWNQAQWCRDGGENTNINRGVRGDDERRSGKRVPARAHGMGTSESGKG